MSCFHSNAMKFFTMFSSLMDWEIFSSSVSLKLTRTTLRMEHTLWVTILVYIRKYFLTNNKLSLFKHDSTCIVLSKCSLRQDWGLEEVTRISWYTTSWLIGGLFIKWVLSVLNTGVWMGDELCCLLVLAESIAVIVWCVYKRLAWVHNLNYCGSSVSYKMLSQKVNIIFNFWGVNFLPEKMWQAKYMERWGQIKYSKVINWVTVQITFYSCNSHRNLEMHLYLKLLCFPTVS